SGHWPSGMMASGGVTLRRFVAADAVFGSDLPECISEPFWEAGTWSGGVLAGLLALQATFRCAATRQAARQKRAVRRRGSKLEPQCEQAALMTRLYRSFGRVR